MRFRPTLFNSSLTVSEQTMSTYMNSKIFPHIFIVIITSLFFQGNAVLIKDVDWCVSPYCKVKPNHTICKWGTMCGARRGCYTKLDFNKKMKDYIMELHNIKRNKIALGNEPRVPEKNRKAANMNVMQWDIHLEFVARCHSRQCDPNHDECRAVPRFPYVGQNIYTHEHSNPEEEDAKLIIDKGIEAWYNEIENVPEEIYSHYNKTNKPSVHFTQMIWAKSGFMGCGLSLLKRPDKSKEYFLVCNYAGTGNIKKRPIYDVGEPCSNCTQSKPCNSQYKGLCGVIKEYPLKCPCEEEQEKKKLDERKG